ncbi:MAG: hypothetical protein JWM10_3027 [Myxococcaceae bacterium]|nr:hypothetical protein [Myxococcaceae bacterium]
MRAIAGGLRRALRLAWRIARTSRLATRVLGFAHTPAQDLIEIDVTFACNLRCLNCDRSCTQAPDAGHMTLAQVERFVVETRESARRWRRVRVLGGEPMIHPDIDRILAILLAWRDRESPDTTIEVVTNGHGRHVQEAIARVPEGVVVKNTRKAGRVQPKFEAFNEAPCDDARFAWTDFAHGCWVTEECGIGLNALGYFPCAVAGGIDRVFREGAGRASLPAEGETFREDLRRACARCGHFRGGWWTPLEDRTPVEGEPWSPTWRAAYARAARGRRRLPLYTEGGAGGREQ